MISRGVLLLGLLFAAPVHAATDPAESAAPTPCVVKGTLVQNATIYDLAKAGQPIAEIHGTARWVQVSDFHPRAQRLRLVSGKSTPTLRVEGYVDAAAMPIGAAKDVSVAGNVLAIRATVPLRVEQMNESIMVGPRTPSFDGIEASVACSDLHVVAEKAAPALPPSATMLVPIAKSLDLFGSAGGTPLLTLRVAASPSSITLNAYETINGYIHVRFAADVLIDGWMRRSELSEQTSGIGSSIGLGGIGTWGTSAAPSYAQRDTEVRLGDQGARVGVLEKGARVARWGTGAGAWTQVRVYDADAHEPPGKAFYVQENDSAQRRHSTFEGRLALDQQQIVTLAPDAASAAAGRKLATPVPWKSLGKNERALWGECKGSALYQVRVDLTDFSSKCSCPSRKFPCKHALGLLFLASSQDIPDAAPPEWVSEWLGKREQTEQRREARAAAPQKAPDPVAQKKREEAREERVNKGVEGLERFLQDLVRTGLAGLESQPGTFEAQAARLVDAQASGLASRVRRLEYASGGDASWPDRMLDRLGRITLLAHAFRRLDAIEGPIIDDIRQAIGFNLEKDEVHARGERVRDVWAVVAQHNEDDERLRSQRSWLRGATTGRTALILQFAPGMAPFPHAIVPSTAFDGELVFWPSATPTRALIDARFGTDTALTAVPGFVSISDALRGVAELLARNPWHERTLLTLAGVVPTRHENRWWLRDGTGASLPIATGAPFMLLAISAGAPIDVVGEWNGDRFFPLAALDQGVHHPLPQAGDD